MTSLDTVPYQRRVRSQYGAVSTFLEAATMNQTSGRDMWIGAALKAMARGGVEQVRVEVLAADLGITKGGFYRRFKDRRALLDALLETWKHGRIAAIEQQTALGGENARDRLKSLIRLYSERRNPEGMAIELAIRQWARS